MSRHDDDLRDLAAAVRALTQAVDRLLAKDRSLLCDRAGSRSRVMLTQDETGEYLRTARSPGSVATALLAETSIARIIGSFRGPYRSRSGTVRRGFTSPRDTLLLAIARPPPFRDPQSPFRSMTSARVSKAHDQD